MKRLLFPLLAVSLLLTACGGSGSSAVACKDLYWDGTIALCLPDGWSVVDQETLAQRGVAEEVIAAFQATKAASGQYPTVTVTREVLSQPTDSPAYSAASIRSVAALPGYKLLDSKKVTVEGESVDLHVFTAQPIAEEPARRFYQVSAVSKGAGYTMTALTPLSVDSTLEQQTKLILGSFGFTEKTAASASK